MGGFLGGGLEDIFEGSLGVGKVFRERGRYYLKVCKADLRGLACIFSLQ